MNGCSCVRRREEEGEREEWVGWEWKWEWEWVRVDGGVEWSGVGGEKLNTRRGNNGKQHTTARKWREATHHQKRRRENSTNHQKRQNKQHPTRGVSKRNTTQGERTDCNFTGEKQYHTKQERKDNINESTTAKKGEGENRTIQNEEGEPPLYFYLPFFTLSQFGLFLTRLDLVAVFHVVANLVTQGKRQHHSKGEEEESATHKGEGERQHHQSEEDDSTNRRRRKTAPPEW